MQTLEAADLETKMSNQDKRLNVLESHIKKTVWSVSCKIDKLDAKFVAKEAADIKEDEADVEEEDADEEEAEEEEAEEELADEADEEAAEEL